MTHLQYHSHQWDFSEGRHGNKNAGRTGCFVIKPVLLSDLCIRLIHTHYLNSPASLAEAGKLRQCASIPARGKKPSQAVRNVTLHVAPSHTYICSEISNVSVCFSGVPPHLSAVIRSRNLSVTCSVRLQFRERFAVHVEKHVCRRDTKKKVNSLSYLVKTHSTQPCCMTSVVNTFTGFF